MKLAELTVTGFADIVSSDAPAPGGVQSGFSRLPLMDFAKRGILFA